MTTPRSAAERAQAIAGLAFRFWEERGCPQGLPDEDWYKAERIIDREQSSEQGNRNPLETVRRQNQQESRPQESDAHA
jgi:Protein of unknown function (DUF2934)